MIKLSEESENQEEKVEQVEKEIVMGNSATGDKIRLKVTEENAEKLRELLKMQNERNSSICAENESLKKKVMDNPAYQGAQLSREQLGLEKETLASDNEGLPISMMSFKDDFDMINQLEKLADSGNVEAKEALKNLLSKATDKSGTWEYQGDPRDLYRVPKTEKERKELNEKRRINWVKVK